MSTVRLYVDEDVYGAVAPQLRQYGFDAVSVSEAGRLGLRIRISSNGRSDKTGPYSPSTSATSLSFIINGYLKAATTQASSSLHKCPLAPSFGGYCSL
jgi:hypothetical protein